MPAPDTHARPGFARELSRRGFVTALACALPALALPDALHAAAPHAGPPGAGALRAEALLTGSATPRELSFVHTHTSERLVVEYFRDGQYLPDALSSVNHFLRDFRTEEVHEIQPELLDLLHRLAGVTEATRPFQVISGYRSPKTNAFLRQHSEGVAAGSLHMVGQAIDIRVDAVPLPSLRAAALSLGRGGVGYYPASDFVHVDTGRVRTW